MQLINQISRKCKNLDYMTHDQAVWLRNVILNNKFSKLCELGFYHGKSTAYFSAILKEQGFGHIHTFDREANNIKPNIDELLEAFKLTEYVTKIVAEKSFIWELGKLIEKNDKPIFDFCYIDGGHDFHTTALAFVLIDKLLESGGMILFDDASWCAEKNLTVNYSVVYPNMSKEESVVPAINFVCDNLVKRYNYTESATTIFDWRLFVKNK